MTQHLISPKQLWRDWEALFFVIWVVSSLSNSTSHMVPSFLPIELNWILCDGSHWLLGRINFASNRIFANRFALTKHAQRERIQYNVTQNLYILCKVTLRSKMNMKNCFNAAHFSIKLLLVEWNGIQFRVELFPLGFFGDLWRTWFLKRKFWTKNRRKAVLINLFSIGMIVLLCAIIPPKHYFCKLESYLSPTRKKTTAPNSIQ